MNISTGCSETLVWCQCDCLQVVFRLFFDWTLLSHDKNRSRLHISSWCSTTASLDTIFRWLTTGLALTAYLEQRNGEVQERMGVRAKAFDSVIYSEAALPRWHLCQLLHKYDRLYLVWLSCWLYWQATLIFKRIKKKKRTGHEVIQHWHIK